MEIWVDRQTGVNYLYAATSQAAGLTVMLNRGGTPIGTPIVTPIPNDYRE